MATTPFPATQPGRETWRPADSIWRVAADWWPRTRYASRSDLVDAIRAANPTVVDWTRLAPGSVIAVPTAPASS